MHNNYWTQFSLPYNPSNNMNSSYPAFMELSTPNSVRDTRTAQYEELHTKCKAL